MMADLIGVVKTHRGHIRVFFEHQRELTDAQRNTIREKRDLYEKYVQGVVERGMADGEFRDLNSRLVTFAIFGMCNWAYQWYRSDGAQTTDELAGFFYDLLLNGLAATA